MPQICDGQPSVYIVGWAPLCRQGSHHCPFERSSSPCTCEATVVDHPAATDQSALQPPGFIDLLSAPITTAFHRLLDQTTYPPFRQSTFQALHHWPSFQSARLLLRTLWKPSVRRIIIPRMGNNHLCWLQVAWRGWSLRIRRLWANHQPKNRP